MTETTFPFDASDAEVPEGTDRRKQYLMLGAGAVLLALVGYFLVLPMFAGSPAPTPTVIPHAARASVVPSVSATPRPIPQTFAGVVGRDPFNPLVRAPVVTAAAAGGTTSTPTTSAGTTSTGTTSTGTTSTGTTSPGATVSSTPSPAASTSPAPPVSTSGMVTFTLLSTSGSTARVSVDGKVYTWTVGKTYLDGFTLVKTGAAGEGFFLYRDMPIHISAGQTYIFAK